jgi:hypothetical protein
VQDLATDPDGRGLVDLELHQLEVAEAQPRRERE